MRVKVCKKILVQASFFSLFNQIDRAPSVQRKEGADPFGEELIGHNLHIPEKEIRV